MAADFQTSDNKLWPMLLLLFLVRARWSHSWALGLQPTDPIPTLRLSSSFDLVRWYLARYPSSWTARPMQRASELSHVQDGGQHHNKLTIA